MPPPTRPTPPGARGHWVTSRRLAAAVLVIWFAVTFVPSWFARQLDVTLFGWPLPYYMGAQGAPLVYLLLIVGYTWAMNRIDRQEDADPESAP